MNLKKKNIYIYIYFNKYILTKHRLRQREKISPFPPLLLPGYNKYNHYSNNYSNNNSNNNNRVLISINYKVVN